MTIVRPMSTARVASGRGWTPERGGVDWVLAGVAVALSGVGLLLVWSSGGAEMARRQAVAVGLGLVAMAVLARLDLRALRSFTAVFYLVAVVLLAAVLPLGDQVNGARSWLDLGLRFQPSELAKVALVLVVAVPLAPGDRGPRARGVLAALGLAGLPIGLIMLQPDLGTALVFTATTAGAVLVSGASKRLIAGLVLASAGAVAWLVTVARPYQIERLAVLLDPSADPGGSGYTAAQAKIAIGSGGLLGRGLFQGEQTAGGFVPEQHTDFIFTVAGEELGFAGCAAILLLVTALLWRGLRIAAASASPYGRVVAGAVVSWLAFQAFVNVGMTVGLMPITGLPLPFVSFGGSATIACLAAVGLLQCVRRTRSAIVSG
ncbi:rod shape-determining protein RodA [Acrocarpospora pleiomorpha]|uniref:Rod shape-determining protein RodA n=2 Tax=Acrocarpospora pleiomorpha TaxID=90975 RepID=A0A5M3XFK0_9ACTN|nr:rod shape-determining protein RodA [Acrocarpospora pleiomorpha]